MDAKELKKLTDLALEPLRKIDAEVETMLIEAENLMIHHKLVYHRTDGSGVRKSDIRYTLEQFEEVLDNVWRQKCVEYKVGSIDDKVPKVLALPIKVYDAVVDEYIRKPVVKIIGDFLHEAPKDPFRFDNLQNNPYVLAIGALMKKYGHVLEKDKV